MLVRRVVLMLAAALLPVFTQAPGKGLVIVLIGPPGGGKTTQAAFLQKRYRIAVLAGDELRQKAGESGEKLNALVREQVLRADAAKGFVIDGYPATRAEADYLGRLVKEAKLPSPIIIQLDVPDAEVRRRLSGKPEAAGLDKRLETYHKELELARSYYPEADIWTIIGTRTPKEVFETIVALIQDRE
ncbi:MAG: nucleoside monophosphate kinase [Bryobacterales bacterium]|nr:nucleoside monophosphate kinase [Bryobacterales bacterium]